MEIKARIVFKKAACLIFLFGAGLPACAFGQDASANLPSKVFLHGYALRNQSGQSLELKYLYPKYDFSKSGSVLEYFQRKGLSTSINPDRLYLEAEKSKNEAAIARMQGEMESARAQGESQLAQLDSELQTQAPDLQEETARLDSQRQAESAGANALAQAMQEELKSEQARADSSWDADKSRFLANWETDRKNFERSWNAQATQRQSDWSRAQWEVEKVKAELEAAGGRLDADRAQAEAQLAEDRRDLEKAEQDVKQSAADWQRQGSGQDKAPAYSAPDNDESGQDSPAAAPQPSWLNPPSSRPVGESDSVLSWDRWYSKMSSIVKEPLIRALARHGNPAGSNTILITVWKDHKLSAKLIKSGNPKFDAAVLEAYQTLNNNPALEFPAGSCRNVVDYYTDHRHSTGGEPIGVTSQVIRGDREYRKIQW